MSSTLVAETIDHPEAVVVKLVGEARMDVSALDRQFTRLLARRPKAVVLDMSGFTFCSSLGMGSLVAFRRDISRCGCVVKLAAVPPLVLDSFKRACLVQLFEVHETLDKALGPSAS